MGNDELITAFMPDKELLDAEKAAPHTFIEPLKRFELPPGLVALADEPALNLQAGSQREPRR
ncbi:hypothetical protein [Timonella senegalensis]|uniref:hypothetical protein n=1 Tax=Timonella senegalensis TaxID=1465825 RepID=UPI0002DE84B6|nr:hypothetical protein [Timonella senegalensis]